MQKTCMCPVNSCSIVCVGFDVLVKHLELHAEQRVARFGSTDHNKIFTNLEDAQRYESTKTSYLCPTCDAAFDHEYQARGCCDCDADIDISIEQSDKQPENMNVCICPICSEEYDDAFGDAHITAKNCCIPSLSTDDWENMRS